MTSQATTPRVKKIQKHPLTIGIWESLEEHSFTINPIAIPAIPETAKVVANPGLGIEHAAAQATVPKRTSPKQCFRMPVANGLNGIKDLVPHVQSFIEAMEDATEVPPIVQLHDFRKTTRGAARTAFGKALASGITASQ